MMIWLVIGLLAVVLIICVKYGSGKDVPTLDQQKIFEEEEEQFIIEKAKLDRK